MKMPLKLERCTIRHRRADDATSLAKNANNRKIWLGLCDPFPHPYTIKNANEFLQRVTSFCIDIGGAAVGGMGLPIGEDVDTNASTTFASVVVLV
jgi:[ribosomal protein S5]-alanine N-acetyltransferase